MWKNSFGDYRRAPSRMPSRPNSDRSSRSLSRGDSRTRGRSEGHRDYMKEGGLKDCVSKLEDNVKKMLENQDTIMKQNEELVKKMKMVGWMESVVENKEIQVKISDVMFLKEVKNNQAMILDT
jgi:hypothetical protein